MNYTEEFAETTSYICVPCPSPSSLLRAGKSIDSKGIFTVSDNCPLDDTDFNATPTQINTMSKIDQVSYVQTRYINSEIKARKAAERERLFLEQEESKAALHADKDTDPDVKI